MAEVQESVAVNVPLQTAYNQWTQFEEFPQFMEGVKEIRQLDDKRLFWRAEILGKDVEWTAEILEQVPDSRISWHSTSGAKNSGLATFTSVDGRRTRVTLRIEVEPDTKVESVGSAVGFLGHRVKGDLRRFKQFIEERTLPTGEWRGEIHGAQVTRPG